MLLAQAGCVFLGVILYISGVGGNQEWRICAPKGSSVNLNCSAEHPTSSSKWFTVRKDENKRWIPTEVVPDGNHIFYIKSEESPPTLMINNLTESDENRYCCRENTEDPKDCRGNAIHLHVSPDVQVKVIPTSEGHTVTLMCGTSCPLTENSEGYNWYRNREFLYQNWSPWYQQLVSSEEAVNYSCAIKGYEDLRAPEVSVVSVTSTCFNVTYAKGSMCSNKQTSEDEPCSITYPREVRVQRNNGLLTCNTSCPETDPKPDYRWYPKSPETSENRSVESFSCTIEGQEDLQSEEVCANLTNCWSVNYVRRRICALQGSSVNISSTYLRPDNQQSIYKSWYEKSGKEWRAVIDDGGHVVYYDNMINHHILTINNLKRDDSAEYRFSQHNRGGRDVSGVTLVVTGLEVKFTPSAKVTEGQRVTLTCSTSCPLPDNTTYIWFFNRRPLTPTENQTKQLVLDPVSSKDTGNYFCDVQNSTKISRSSEETLTVQNIRGNQTAAAAAAAAGVSAVLLVTILLVIFFWIRKKRTSGQSRIREATGNTEQLNLEHVYENISARPAEQEGLHYSRVHFAKTQTDDLYATVQPHPIRGQERVAYAVVNLRPNTFPQ